MASNKEYTTSITHATACEAVIKAFQTSESEATAPLLLDFSQKSPAAWLEVTKAYQEAFAVYFAFNQVARAQG